MSGGAIDGAVLGPALRPVRNQAPEKGLLSVGISGNIEDGIILPGASQTAPKHPYRGPKRGFKAFQARLGDGVSDEH